MYLYFDNRGVLKEIINDTALRQGDYGNDNIYIYVEGITAETIANYSVWIRFQKSNGTVSEEMEVQASPITSDDAIPFNPKRDLRFFKYYTDYPFFVIPFTQDVTLDQPGIDPDAYDYDMLDTPGNVALTVSLVAVSRKVLGLIVFNVEQSTEDLSNTVQVEEYLSLAQWNYLLAQLSNMLNGNQTYEGVKTFHYVELDGANAYIKIYHGSNYVEITRDDGDDILINRYYNGNDYTYHLPNESGILAIGEKTARVISTGGITTLNDALLQTLKVGDVVQENGQIGYTVYYKSDTEIKLITTNTQNMYEVIYAKSGSEFVFTTMALAKMLSVPSAGDNGKLVVANASGGYDLQTVNRSVLYKHTIQVICEFQGVLSATIEFESILSNDGTEVENDTQLLNLIDSKSLSIKGHFDDSESHYCRILDAYVVDDAIYIVYYNTSTQSVSEDYIGDGDIEEITDTPTKL